MAYTQQKYEIFIKTLKVLVETEPARHGHSMDIAGHIGGTRMMKNRKKVVQPDIIFTVPASRKFSVQIFYYT